MLTGRYLLIDNSNSFTKLALASEDGLLERRRTSTRELTAQSIQETVTGWEWEGAVLSSVVPEKAALLTEVLAARPLLRVSAAIDLGVGIEYPEPASIGADRLANAASAAAEFGAPVLVVDFGTAVSFDIIARPGVYVGGVIAPGLEAMTDYLHQRTALLPKIDLLEPPSAIGKSTKHAMLAGAVYGYRGLVREILAQIRKELGEPELPVVGTGGYAELIAAGLPEITALRPDLNLDGLRIIARRNHFPSRAGVSAEGR